MPNVIFSTFIYETCRTSVNVIFRPRVNFYTIQESHALYTYINAHGSATSGNYLRLQSQPEISLHVVYIKKSGRGKPDTMWPCGSGIAGTNLLIKYVIKKMLTH